MKIQKGKSLIKWQNQRLKYIKRTDDNYSLPVRMFKLKNIRKVYLDEYYFARLNSVTLNNTDKPIKQKVKLKRHASI